MKLPQLVKNIPHEAHWLAAGSLMLLITKFYLLNNFAALFPGAHEAGLLMESILGSIISGYVFYFFVEQITESKKIKVVEPFITKKCNFIAGQAKGLLAELSIAAGVNVEFSNVTEELLRDALKKINPMSHSPLFLSNTGAHANWMQYIEYYKIRTIAGINRLQNQLNYLSPEISKTIGEIEDCHLFNMLSVIQKNLRNDDMTFLSSTLYEWISLSQRLLAEVTQYENEFA